MNYRAFFSFPQSITIFQGWNHAPSGYTADATRGFKYQVEDPPLPKPGKHERCEVTETKSQKARSVPRPNKGV